MCSTVEILMRKHLPRGGKERDPQSVCHDQPFLHSNVHVGAEHFALRRLLSSSNCKCWEGDGVERLH